VAARYRFHFDFNMLREEVVGLAVEFYWREVGGHVWLRLCHHGMADIIIVSLVNMSGHD
jgi:hypothetical protein